MKRIIKNVFWFFLSKTKLGRCISETKNNQTPITFKVYLFQKIFGINKQAYWPMSFKSTVVAAQNIYVGIDSSPGYSPECYIQGGGELYIGDYTQIGPNVGLISSNHDLYDTNKKVKSTTRIGDYCWIGMNSVVLPGVELGDFTIVAAGSVVTKSFPGDCVIGGNPAKLLKELDSSKTVPYELEHKYNGYIRNENFESFRKKKLKV